jgi:hypothetical protein
VKNLTALIDEALDACKALDPNNPVRVSNREVLEWLRANHPEMSEFDVQMADSAWESRIGARRKARLPVEEIRASKQICLDLGLDQMELDSEISIPRDRDNPLRGGVEWKEPDDATIEEIESHIQLLRAMEYANREKADNWTRVLRAALPFCGGNREMIFGEARRIARNVLPPRKGPGSVPSEISDTQTDAG